MVFVKIYQFFTQHKFLLYALLVLSSVVFAFFATKSKFEEDLMKLLPKSEKSECDLVFGNVKVKDKLFMQMTGAEPEVMVGYVDELMDAILTNDDAARVNQYAT